MSLDFYDILGIEKNANPEEIKAAYFELSKVHHPDKGGDPEEFHTINRAYETLIDPEKRAFYDEHGEEKKQDNQFSEIVGIAIEMFKEASQRNPSSLTGAIFTVYDNGIKTINRSINNLKNQISEKEKILSRIISSPENNFIKSQLNSEIESHRNQIAELERCLEVTKKAYKLLTEYEFTVEEKQSFTFEIRGGRGQLHRPQVFDVPMPDMDWNIQGRNHA